MIFEPLVGRRFMVLDPMRKRGLMPNLDVYHNLAFPLVMRRAHGTQLAQDSQTFSKVAKDAAGPGAA